MIQAFITGNLVRDPEIRKTQNGHDVCNFTVATRTNQRDANGEYESAFIQVSVFGRQASTASTYLKKGSKIGVVGPFSTRDYVSKDGTAKVALQVTADRFEFLSSVEEDAAQAPAAAPKRKAKAAPAAAYDEEDDLPF